jgi:serine protease SohB
VEDIAASGGYWLACAGDEIFIDPSSILGSIGVISATFGLTDLIAKLGVERRVYTAGASKNQLDAFLPEKPDEVGRWKEKLAQIHEVFIAHVKARRGARLSTDPRLFTGEIFIGREALELGLADRFGDLHGVVRERFGRKAKVKPIPIGKPGLVSRLLGRAGTDAAEAALAAIDRRALWARYGL